MSCHSNCFAQSSQYVKTSTPRSDSRRTATHPSLSSASVLRPQSSHCIAYASQTFDSTGFHKERHISAFSCALGSTDGERLVTEAAQAAHPTQALLLQRPRVQMVGMDQVSPQQQFTRAPRPRSGRTLFVATMPRGPSVVLPLPRIGRAAAFTSDAAPGRLGQGARVEARVAST